MGSRYEIEGMEAEQTNTMSSQSPLASSSTSPDTIVSKRAQKRLAREKRWEALKPIIKAQRKEKLRLAKEQKRQRAAEDAASGLVPHPGLDAAAAKVERRPLRATLVIDLGFDHLMNEKEVKSLALQLTFVYAANRKTNAPFEHIVLAGGSDQAEADLTTAFSSSSSSAAAASSSTTTPLTQPPPNLLFSQAPTGVQIDARTAGSWARWRNVQVVDSGNVSALLRDSNRDAPRSDSTFAPEDIIYLTADSENVIHQLEEGKAYVLGGIVDKNRYKNLCFDKAQRLGVQTAQLPISDALFDPSDDEAEAEGESESQQQRTKGSELFKLRSRKVLTVNQVADILIGWNEQRFQALRRLESRLEEAEEGGERQSVRTGDNKPHDMASEASAPQWDTAELEHWWRAAVKQAFPRRKLKERAPRRKPWNEKLAAEAASAADSQRTSGNDAEIHQAGVSMETTISPLSDEHNLITKHDDELYNTKLQT